MNRFLHILLFFITILPLVAEQNTPIIEHRNGYSIQLVRIPVSLHDTTEAYLLLPDQQPKAAILALHDHGAHFTIGKEKLCRPILSPDSTTAERNLLLDADKWANKFYEGAFVADSLAAHGYIVLVPDALYWGSRTPEPVDWSQSPDSIKRLNHRLKAEQPGFYQQHLVQTGTPWFETILQDDRACITYLKQLKRSNTTNTGRSNATKSARPRLRIGVWGFSMGAYRAWQLASEDKRVRFCAASHWMTTLQAHGGPTPDVSSWSMYRPISNKQSSISNKQLEYSTQASRIAPRPFLLQYGTQDPLFPVPSVQEAIHNIHNTKLSTLNYKKGHQFSHQHLQDLLNWLNQQNSAK